MNMKNLNKTDIGLIGLAVMGENLALNMADKGWNVSVYNRTVPGVEEGVVERFVNGRAKGKKIEGYTDIAIGKMHNPIVRIICLTSLAAIKNVWMKEGTGNISPLFANSIIV